MKKNLLISTLILFIFTVLGVFLYSKYIKFTLKEIENKLLAEIDSTKNIVKVPKDALYKNCKYDNIEQTDQFLKGKTEFSNYTWNETTKIATIFLDPKNTILIERGGCNQFHFYCSLQQQDSEFNADQKNEIYKKALWLAEKFFDKNDFRFFQYAISNGEYQIQQYNSEFLISFTSENYCKASLYFSKNYPSNTLIIKIGYTLC